MPSAGAAQTAKPLGADPIGPPLQPRLSIGHVMLWTLGSAIILAAYRALVDTWEMPTHEHAFLLVMQVSSSVMYGAALSSVILFLHRRLTDGPVFPVQPGHWLLLTTGVLCVVSWLGYAAIHGARWFETSDDSAFLTFLLQQFVVNASGVLLLVLAVIHLKDTKYWRSYFWANLMLHGVQGALGILGLAGCAILGAMSAYSVYSIQFGLHWFAAILVLVWLLVAATLDWRRVVRRDWLHWTGVVVGLGGPILFLIHWAWAYLTNRPV